METSQPVAVVYALRSVTHLATKISAVRRVQSSREKTNQACVHFECLSVKKTFCSFRYVQLYVEYALSVTTKLAPLEKNVTLPDLHPL